MTLAQIHSLNIIRIPKQLCEYAVVNKLQKHMRLYLYLKVNCSGKMRISDRDKQDIANTFGISTKTVYNHLNRLIELNWIGHNKASGYYFIRSMRKVMQMYGFTSKTTAELDTRDILKSIEFITAAPIAYLVNAQVRNRKENATVETDKICLRSNQAVKEVSFPVSNKALSKCLGVSRSKAYRLKKSVKNSQFMTINTSWINTGLDAFQMANFRANNPEGYKARDIDGRIVIMQPDRVKHTIRFKGKNTKQANNCK